MVTRTTGRILVSEQQLEKALRIVETALAELGLVADIDVGDDRDPETDDPPERTVIRAWVRNEVDIDLLIDETYKTNVRLREAGLGYPAVPLMVLMFAAW